MFLERLKTLHETVLSVTNLNTLRTIGRRKHLTLNSLRYLVGVAATTKTMMVVVGLPGEILTVQQNGSRTSGF
jgi:hypothetical protein